MQAPGLVRAAVVSYPVTDLYALAAETHRFERHYTDTLVGPLPAADAAWRARSPITRAASLSVPVLVLQGDIDPVVPMAHTRAFVDAVRTAGGAVDLHVYAGEGHGWKRADTAADALGRTVDFITERCA
jgi:dipeptidyl aminopeptidase/acylaminoacyl peptidase